MPHWYCTVSAAHRAQPSPSVIESKGKVIYKSQRVGSNYRIFNFLKFRSMYTDADKRLKELNALNQYKLEEEHSGRARPTSASTT